MIHILQDESRPSRRGCARRARPTLLRAKPARPAGSATPPAAATVPRPSQQPRPDPAARAELRSAARARRKYERAEVRRFTRRARNRRVAIALVLGTMASLVIIILAAIFSPNLALRQIQIDGTSRVSADEIHSAVDGQLGTPLALIDYGKLTGELAAFPLIRSFVTEVVPPDTLLIHIVERQPVGAILTGGTFHLVDPAGVTVQESADRLPGVPVIDIGGAPTSGVVFDSVVEVLLSLPPELLAQVDSVSATTQDNIGRAASAHQADIVALSFSVAFPQRQIPGLLQQLRLVLTAETALWAGGSGVARLAETDGIRLLSTLDAALKALSDWHQKAAMQIA